MVQAEQKRRALGESSPGAEAPWGQCGWGEMNTSTSERR